MSPVVLIIMDGWGISPKKEYNAVASARTPVFDSLRKKYPNIVLQAAGLDVGLPHNFQGSSEVGHLNLGAGRVVEQEIKRINEFFSSDFFRENKALRRIFENCKKNNSHLHLMGLVQNEGVHAHDDHLVALIKLAKEWQIKKVYIHFFADGRDSPPRSALEHLTRLKNNLAQIGLGEVATLMGRAYAMDRGENWEVTDEAYGALVEAKGRRVKTAEEAIKKSYEEDFTLDGREMFDEYIPPSIIGDFGGIRDSDSVIHFNYRQDRAIQLTQAFIEEDYPGQRKKRVKVTYLGLTRYYDSFPHYVIDPIHETEAMKNIFPQVLSKEGLNQLRITEEQKFSHATSFFNGKKREPYFAEEQVKVPSLNFRLYAEYPQMSAREITETLKQKLASKKYDFILINYANCDMVGHTGNFVSTIKAVETVDKYVGEAVKIVLKLGGTCFVTADHGNAEEMIHEDTGQSKTSHTTNPVPFIYVAKDYQEVKLKEKGRLADIAPTMLHLLRKKYSDLETPREMTGENLIR